MNVQETQGNTIKLIVLYCLFNALIKISFLFPGLNNQPIEIDCAISDAVRDLNNVLSKNLLYRQTVGARVVFQLLHRQSVGACR